MFSSPRPSHDPYSRRFSFPSDPHLRPPTLLSLQPEHASPYASSYTPSWLLSTSPLTPPSFTSLPSPTSSLSSPTCQQPDIQAFLAAELSRPIPPSTTDPHFRFPLSSPSSSPFSPFTLLPPTRSPPPRFIPPASSTAPSTSSHPSPSPSTYTKHTHRRHTSHTPITPLPPNTPITSPSSHRPLRKKHGASCHQCKTTMPVSELSVCTAKAGGVRKRGCRKKFCGACLGRCYEVEAVGMTREERARWVCPACLCLCYCAACSRQKAAALPSSASPSHLPPARLWADVRVSTSPTSSSDDSTALSLSSSLDTLVEPGGEEPGMEMGLVDARADGVRPTPLSIPPSPSRMGEEGWDGEGEVPFEPLCIAREPSIPFFSFPAEPHCAPRGGSWW